SDIINKGISPSIFKYGIDNIRGLTTNANIWNERKRECTDTYIKKVINSNSLDDLISNKFKNYNDKPLIEIIKDNDSIYLVDSNLNILDVGKTQNSEHPLIKIYNIIHKKINERNGNFNLGRMLQFLTKPPYGVYHNAPYETLIGFIMRSFIGKLYYSGTDEPINKENTMLELVKTLINYLKTNQKKYETKLDLRLMSHNEEKLIEKLTRIFKIDNADGINKLRWSIRNWITNELGYPLWVYKGVINDRIDTTIDKIISFINSLDEEIDDKTITELLDTVENNEIELTSIKKETAEDNFKKW
ncbi:MAG: hypothetical protein ACOCUI_04025, partial [bacterium]